MQSIYLESIYENIYTFIHLIFNNFKFLSQLFNATSSQKYIRE